MKVFKSYTYNFTNQRFTNYQNSTFTPRRRQTSKYEACMLPASSAFIIPKCLQQFHHFISCVILVFQESLIKPEALPRNSAFTMKRVSELKFPTDKCCVYFLSRGNSRRFSPVFDELFYRLLSAMIMLVAFEREGLTSRDFDRD